MRTLHRGESLSFLQKAQRAKDFDEILLEAVDEALSVLGEVAKEAVFGHLQKHYSLHKTDIPKEIGVFRNALESMFGKVSGRIVCNLILKTLYQRIGATLPGSGMDLGEAVTKARKLFLEGRD